MDDTCQIEEERMDITGHVEEDNVYKQAEVDVVEEEEFNRQNECDNDSEAVIEDREQNMSNYLFVDATDEMIGEDVVVTESDLTIIAYGQLISVENLACRVQLHYVRNVETDVLPSVSEVNREVDLIRKYVKKPKSTVELIEDGFNLHIMNLSQYNCSAAGTEGSSACMGISMCMAETFIDGRINFLPKDPRRALVPFSVVIQKTVSRWKKEANPPLSTAEVISLLGLKIQIKEEKWWPGAESSLDEESDEESVFKTCEILYKMAVESNEREAIIITLHPNHTFSVLIDENGDQFILNSHLFYEDCISTFHEVVETEGRGASVLCVPSSDWEKGLRFILQCYPKYFRAETKAGEMSRICSKNE